AERPLPQRQDRHGSQQIDAIIGRELDRLGRDQRDVYAHFAQALDDLLEALGSELRTADQHLIDLTTAGSVAEGRQVADHRQVIDLEDSGAIVGDADKAQMWEFKRFEQLPGERDRIRISAIESDPLLNLSLLGEPRDDPVEDR